MLQVKSHQEIFLLLSAWDVSKTFSTNQNLKNHILTRKQKPFCQKCFTHTCRSILKTQHTKKNLSNVNCQKCFTQRNNLRSHTKEKPYLGFSRFMRNEKSVFLAYAILVIWKSKITFSLKYSSYMISWKSYEYSKLSHEYIPCTKIVSQWSSWFENVFVHM